MGELLAFSRDFRQNKGFDTRWAVKGVTPTSKVMVSICEMGNFSGELKPFQGQATMMVHNVVPEKDHIRVRGYIDWKDNELDVRLHFIVVLEDEE